jgi:hypothetical protein
VDAVTRALVQGGIEQARRLAASGVHWLFTDEATTRRIQSLGPGRRLGCQFHWHNPGYRDFADFLDAMTARRRKEVRRERRQALADGMGVEVLDGHQASDSHWQVFDGFYRSTFARKSGVPTLSQGFFQEIGRTLPDAVVLLLARHSGRYVAGTLSLLGADTLYGRHWGTTGYHPALHFELCYYRPIELAIERRLERFEAGAQGEHKVSRGLLPVPTYSAHWIEHPGLRRAVAQFLGREEQAVRDYMREVATASPFRAAPGAAPDLD